jgi:hypothetical protein
VPDDILQRARIASAAPAPAHCRALYSARQGARRGVVKVQPVALATPLRLCLQAAHRRAHAGIAQQQGVPVAGKGAQRAQAQALCSLRC